MNTINAKYLRKNLKKVTKAVKESQAEYLVLYRSAPAFRIIPIEKYKSKLRNKEWEKWLDKVAGSSTATDVTTPDKDKEILRKRLIEKHTKHLS